MNIKQIFDEIAAESGTNAKMDILAKYKNNKLLERVLYVANTKRIKFFIKQIPNYEPDNKLPKELDWALDGLNKLSSREFTGQKATNWLNVLLS
jgi:hypothetical protein